MNLFFSCALIWLIGSSTMAESTAPGINSWRTFRSDMGYELKYPDCWQVKVDDPDEGMEGKPATASKHVSASKTVGCIVNASSSVVEHGISIVGGLGPKKTKEEAIKKIESEEKFAPNNVASKAWLVFKRFQLGSNDAVAWAETLRRGKLIRWHVNIYCPDWWLSVSGPEILNPDPTYEEKFKKGDLALPEPEKTIIESIRCVPAKPDH